LGEKMRKLGAFLVIGGCSVATGYLIYWFLAAVAESIPLPLKIAIAAATIGLLLLLVSISRERSKASKEEDFKEVER
jgi:membrane protein implicated in regulation of membrane protease activity